MLVLKWLHRLEAAFCTLGFFVMAAALIADVGARLILGHGLVGAAQLGLVGMLMTALFGVGLAADAGGHFRPRVLDQLRPQRWEPVMLCLGHVLSAAFFMLLAGLSAAVAAESRTLADVTSLLRWPVWLLQAIFVVAFAGNALRYLIFAWRPCWAQARPAPESARAGR